MIAIDLFERGKERERGGEMNQYSKRTSFLNVPEKLRDIGTQLSLSVGKFFNTQSEFAVICLSLSLSFIVLSEMIR